MKTLKIALIVLLVVVYLYFSLMIFNIGYPWIGIGMIVVLAVGALVVLEVKLRKKKKE